jgi:hypothetical protein
MAGAHIDSHIYLEVQDRNSASETEAKYQNAQNQVCALKVQTTVAKKTEKNGREREVTYSGKLRRRRSSSSEIWTSGMMGDCRLGNRTEPTTLCTHQQQRLLKVKKKRNLKG